MSHWTTSGRSRLKAKQNRSFAQRAQQRANVVAPPTMMLSGNHGHPPSAPPNHPSGSYRRTSNGRRSGYSYGNPIARRGVVVPIIGHSSSGGSGSGSGPRGNDVGATAEADYDASYATPTTTQGRGGGRRIRDPALHFHGARSMPAVPSQQQQQQRRRLPGGHHPKQQLNPYDPVPRPYNYFPPPQPSPHPSIMVPDTQRPRPHPHPHGYGYGYPPGQLDPGSYPKHHHHHHHHQEQHQEQQIMKLTTPRHPASEWVEEDQSSLSSMRQHYCQGGPALRERVPPQQLLHRPPRPVAPLPPPPTGIPRFQKATNHSVTSSQEALDDTYWDVELPTGSSIPSSEPADFVDTEADVQVINATFGTEPGRLTVHQQRTRQAENRLGTLFDRNVRGSDPVEIFVPPISLHRRPSHITDSESYRGAGKFRIVPPLVSNILEPCEEDPVINPNPNPMIATTSRWSSIVYGGSSQYETNTHRGGLTRFRPSSYPESSSFTERPHVQDVSTFQHQPASIATAAALHQNQPPPYPLPSATIDIPSFQSTPSPTLRFFNNGVEVDMDGRHLSRPGSPPPKRSKLDEGHLNHAPTLNLTPTQEKTLYEQCF